MSDKTLITNMSEADLKLRGIPEGMPSVSFPFSNFGDIETKLIKQKYRCLLPAVYWGLDTPIDAETARTAKVNPDDYFVVEESEPTSVCPGVVEIERTFATLPPAYTEFESQIVNYPGISQAYIDETTTTFATEISGYDKSRKAAKLFIGKEYARKYVKIAITRTIKDETYVNADVTSYSSAILVADDGYAYMAVLGDYFHNIEVNSILLTSYQRQILYVVEEITLLNYYLDYRKTFTTTGRMMVENRFVKISSNADFATIPLPSPYLEDWTISLSGTEREKYARAVQNSEPLVYDYPTFARWKGNIYQIRTNHLIPL